MKLSNSQNRATMRKPSLRLMRAIRPRPGSHNNRPTPRVTSKGSRKSRCTGSPYHKPTSRGTARERLNMDASTPEVRETISNCMARHLHNNHGCTWQQSILPIHLASPVLQIKISGNHPGLARRKISHRLTIVNEHPGKYRQHHEFLTLAAPRSGKPVRTKTNRR